MTCASRKQPPVEVYKEGEGGPLLLRRRSLPSLVRMLSARLLLVAAAPLALLLLLPHQSAAGLHRRHFFLLQDLKPEPVFLSVYGAQESILRNEFRQPMQPGGPVR
jgi:hypothetical protein